MNKMRCYIITGGGRKEIFVPLNHIQVEEILATGKVVMQGRWFFSI